ncbi:hypothetical protein LZ31DRAFT_313704 [Colletotrichum somersetense]|nr:hypothetical protein LZ31DRAFT_313704 [Colletotrichum somersetense]
MPTQAHIVKNYNKFYFIQSGKSCSSVASANSITLVQFLEWNPSAGSSCAGLWANAYACVDIIGGATATSSPTTTTTTTGNGIATPTPTQPNMIGNYDAFYRVVSGDTCVVIAGKSGISLSQFVQWNPSVGSSCSGLWLDAYVCISIIGHAPTPTKPGNGVATPTPIQDGMTKSCKRFTSWSRVTPVRPLLNDTASPSLSLFHGTQLLAPPVPVCGLKPMPAWLCYNWIDRCVVGGIKCTVPLYYSLFWVRKSSVVGNDATIYLATLPNSAKG